jgi:hypothetical protein
MRKAALPFVLSMGLIGVWAAPADAASTRAEYIAQVDPICQSFVGPENDAGNAFFKNMERVGRIAKSGSAKALARQARRTARPLSRLAQIDLSLNAQLAAVPPPPPDAGLIGTWLDGRRQADGLLTSAASALTQLKFRVFLKRFGRALAVNDAANSAVSGFGFQICGVIV